MFLRDIISFKILKLSGTALFKNLFNQGDALPDIDYDAKLSENRSNRASLLHKALNENLTLPSGRGLAMIHAFMHDVHVNVRGNHLRMIRRKED